MKKLRVFKVREGAKLPVRAHPTDAGMDLFFCPNDGKEQRVYPGKTFLFETGLKISVPQNHMLEIKNKSGVATNRQMVVGACVVDSGYDGEIYINLHNVGTFAQVIKPGEKIAQAVLVPIVTPEIEEIHEDKVYDHTTERGAGGFGSTGLF